MGFLLGKTSMGFYFSPKSDYYANILFLYVLMRLCLLSQDEMMLNTVIIMKMQGLGSKL